MYFLLVQSRDNVYKYAHNILFVFMFNYAHADDLDLYTLSLYCTVSTSALEQKAVSIQQTKILNLVGTCY